LSRDAAAAPAGALEPAVAAGTLTLLYDGSFELGPPPASGWTETTSPASERIGDWSGIWYKAAYEGTYDYWAGGYDDLYGLGITSSVRQTLTVPADSAALTFHYLAWRVDPDDSPADGDSVYVAVNGVRMWRMAMTTANNTRPAGLLTWSDAVRLDLRAWAGQSIELTFGGASEGDFTGNVRFDAVEFLPSTVPVEARSWGSVKTAYRR
jgi:hypothetical protein